MKEPKMFLVIEGNAEDAALISMAFDSLESCSAFVCRNLREAKVLNFEIAGVIPDSDG